MKKINIKKVRFMTQMIMLASVIVAAFNHYLGTIDKSIPFVSEANFHYICPICGVTSLYQFITSSSLWVVKLKSTLGIIIGLVIMVSVILGPIVCGFLCPFGAIQDLSARIGRKIWGRKYNTFIPEKIDSKLKYLRYVTLIATIVLTSISGGIMILEKINPYHGFLGLFNGKISYIGLFIFGIVILSSMFVQRAWCKYLCPYGAFLGLFNKIKVFRIVRNNKTCVGCKKCNKSCPMNIEITEKEEVRNLSCISCFECVDSKVCPKNETIIATSKEIEEIGGENNEK